MKTRGKIAVAGVTGRVGRHVVDVLEEQGRDVVAISRSAGIDVVTGEGLAEALRDVDSLVDATSGASPEQQAATDFFTAATRNMQELGARAGVRRIVVVSIIGTDRFTVGYGAAKQAHERAMLAGPTPATIVRAAQFHEFVAQLMDWADRTARSTYRRCAPSWSPPTPSPRRSPTSPPGAGRGQRAGPTECRSSRSPGRARRAWSRPRDCSPLIAARRCGSRP
jgi:uncharacterized protein YbjT (DUF2867 family)